MTTPKYIPILCAVFIIVAGGAVLPLMASGQQSKLLLNCPNDINLRTFKPLQRDSFARPANFKSGEEFTLDGIIEVSSDITTNQIWTANNTYHVVSDISVQALLVIEPGTIVEFAPGKSMSVNNGGTLISAGTPDNPIIYTSDSATPGYGDYYCPILIEETASASTKITYNYIEYAEFGIWVMNNRLDSPIENNYLYNNSFGILEYGIEHTDIYNNLIYATYDYAIEIHMESYGGTADANSHILINNNTCDYWQDVGIIVYGVPNLGDAGEVVLTNNIVSESQYGIALVNGYMYPTVANTGYYDNTANKYGEFDEDNPVIETQMPYVEGTDILPVCYLKQDCNFINAGYEYIEETRLIGKTTDVGSFPDSNKTDIGFHYPNWNFSNAGSTTLYADFDNNLRVDFNDLLQFADYWLYDYDENHERWLWDLDNNGTIDINDLDTFSNYWLIYINFVNFASFAQHWHQEVDYSFMFVKYDLNNDRFIDFLDFALFANEWQQSCEPIPANISPDFSEDPNNLSGYVQVSISVTDPNIHRAFVLLDGKKHGEFGDLFDP